MSFFFEARTEKDAGKEFQVFRYKTSARVMNVATFLVLVVALFIFLSSFGSRSHPNFGAVYEFLLIGIIVLLIQTIIFGVGTRGKYWPYVSDYILAFRHKEVRVKGKLYSLHEPVEFWIEK